jgi:3-dehydroquinate dehydratase type I
LLAEIREYAMAEIRLDLCDLKIREIRELFKSHDNLIATFRKSAKINDKKRKNQLIRAMESGAAFIDLDYINDSEIFPELHDVALKNGCRLIISYHDYEKTPSIEFISDIISKMLEAEADLIKLAFTSNSDEDNKRVLSLYDNYDNLLAFNMGEKGKITRSASLRLGAPFTYVCGANSPTAEGQMTLIEMKLYSRKAVI